MATDILSTTSLLNWEWSEEHVDHLVDKATSVRELIGDLMENTIASVGTSLAGANVESHFWPWNRASDTLFEKQRPDDAVEVCCAMYLAFLSLQTHFQSRLHKGMPLCNIGYAIGKTSKNREIQAKSWVLGIIEDVLTDPETAIDRLSFRNLLTMGGANRLAAVQLTTTIEISFVEEGLTPLFPESCVEGWLDRTRKAPSEACAENIKRLSESLAKSYPKLPICDSYFGLLVKSWEFADWSKGVLGG